MVNLFHTIVKLIRSEVELKNPQKSGQNDIKYDKTIDGIVKKIINIEIFDLTKQLNLNFYNTISYS